MKRVGLVLVTSWCAAFPAVAADTRVVLWPSLGTTTSVTVSGRAMSAPPAQGNTTLSKNLRRLTAPSQEDARVEVRFAGASRVVTSGTDGAFSATFEARETPFAPGLQRVEARAAGGPVTFAVVNVLPADAPFFVVSDFDDTVAITNVRSTRGLFTAALLQDEASQPPVPGMAGLYGCFAQRASTPLGIAVVSGSPLQYATRIATFLARHRFPHAGLYLRDLGPSTLRGYKQPIIRALMKQIPLPVILVGDSGEHDPEVYREIATEFPGRVKAIYIRDAGGDTGPTRLEGQLLFKEPKRALADAVAKGFAPAECTLGLEELTK